MKNKLVIFDCDGVLINNYNSAVKNVEAVLKFLQDNNIDKAVASNANSSLIRVMLDKAKLGQYFKDEEIFGIDMVKSPKPDPAIFLKAANSKGYPVNDCIVIEDSYMGIMAANKAGMNVIWFNEQEAELPDGVKLNSICHNMEEILGKMKELLQEA